MVKKVNKEQIHELMKSFGKLRWKGATKAEKSAHGRKMIQARWAKQQPTKSKKGGTK